MPGNNAIGTNRALDMVPGSSPDPSKKICKNASGCSTHGADLASDLSAVQMAAKNPLLESSEDVKRKICTYLSDGSLLNFCLVARPLWDIAGQELKLREIVKTSKKFIDSYIGFEGLAQLSTAELVMIVEALNGKALANKIKKNEKEIWIAFAEAFKNLAGRIAQAEPPSRENGRIYSTTIPVIPPGHKEQVMLPNLLVTFYNGHSYIFELRGGGAHENGIEAVPCIKYGENAESIHPGRCLGVSANTKVLVLHRPEQDEIKILTAGNEKSFTTSAVAPFRNGDIFSGDALERFSITPDGKSLYFISNGTGIKTLVQGFSNTPDDVKTFKLKYINLYGNQDTPHYNYYMTESADHTWALVSAVRYRPIICETFFLSLPLGAPPEICVLNPPIYPIERAAILPDNTIAGASYNKIEIYGSDAKVRAARKFSYDNIYCINDVNKIQASPDGRTLAVLLQEHRGSGPGSEALIAFYQRSEATTSANLIEGDSSLSADSSSSGDSSSSNDSSYSNDFLQSSALYAPKLIHLWILRLENAASDYDFTFIDYGSKLALCERANPSERIIIELIQRTETA